MYLRGNIYYTDFYDGNGKRWRVSLKTSDEDIAKKKETDFIVFIQSKKPVKTESILWADFKRWYDKFLSGNRSEGTQYLHHLAIRYLEEYKIPQYLRNITPEFLLGLKEFLEEKSLKNHNKPGPAGRNRTIKAIKSMMKTAEDFKKIGVKQSWRIIKQDKTEKESRIEFHSLYELQQIYEVVKGDLRTAFFLGWEEGLRRSEMAYLYKTDYNPTLHTITISSKPGWLPKTKKSARTIPLRPASEKAILESIANSPADSPYIINIPGDRSKRTYLSYQYIHLLQKELPNLHCFLHKLRHTYGTFLIQRGTHIKVVCDLMGHSNILQTEKYVHLGQSQYAAAVSCMPSLVL